MTHWKNIVALEGVVNYEVSDEGEIRHIINKTIRNQHINPQTGYMFITLYNRSRKKMMTYSVSRIVAETFLRERPPGYLIDHRNRDRCNNHISNLRWVTKSESIRNRNKSKPTSRRYYRIPDFLRNQMKYLIARGVPQTVIGRATGLHNSTVSKYAKVLAS